MNKRHHGAVPYGFRRTEEGCLIEHEEEQARIRQMRSMRAMEGGTLRAIKQLMELDLSLATIARIVREGADGSA
jgi:hypothetical protein